MIWVVFRREKEVWAMINTLLGAGTDAWGKATRN